MKFNPSEINMLAGFILLMNVGGSLAIISFCSLELLLVYMFLICTCMCTSVFFLISFLFNSFSWTSNRAAAFLNLVKLNKALTDAETTITLNPQWEKVDCCPVLHFFGEGREGGCWGWFWLVVGPRGIAFASHHVWIFFFVFCYISRDIFEKDAY